VRIYVPTSSERWWAIAAQIPGTASEDVPDREEAIARCRRYAADELEAFRRLGAPLDIDPEEDLIEWKMPWWLIPDSLVPISPALRDAAVRRMDELAAEVDHFLEELDQRAWDAASDGGWSIRRVLDHVAGGFEIGLRRLQPWPLDPAQAHAEALDDLVARLRALAGKRFALEQSGMNQELTRVRWTPRKVVRAVRHLQDEATAHYRGDGPAPSPMGGHADATDDDEPIAESDLRHLLVADAELQCLASSDRRVRGIAMWYRYYRDRLTEWPIDVRERWRVMRDAFARRLLALDERELALVRLVPNGQCSAVRMELGLGLSHVREHLAQMHAIKDAPAGATTPA
jgi:hypothetical protein